MSFGVRQGDLEAFGVLQPTRPLNHPTPLNNAINNIFQRQNFSSDSADDFFTYDVQRQLWALHVREPTDAQVHDVNSDFWAASGDGIHWSWRDMDFTHYNQMSQGHYAAISPALHLASLLLAHSAPFLARIEGARIRRDGLFEAMSWQQLTQPALTAEVVHRLQQIARRVHFFYGEELGRQEAVSDIFYSPVDRRVAARKATFLQGQHPFYIKITKSMIDALTVGNLQTQNDRDRILLELGLTLVHVWFPHGNLSSSWHIDPFQLS